MLENYVDESGKECIRQVRKTLESPTEEITFADIRVAGGTITVYQPDPDKICAEPFVRYNYDVASGTYKSIISFTNVGAITYDESYV